MHTHNVLWPNQSPLSPIFEFTHLACVSIFNLGLYVLICPRTTRIHQVSESSCKCILCIRALFFDFGTYKEKKAGGWNALTGNNSKPTTVTERLHFFCRFSLSHHSPHRKPNAARGSHYGFSTLTLDWLVRSILAQSGWSGFAEWLLEEAGWQTITQGVILVVVFSPSEAWVESHLLKPNQDIPSGARHPCWRNKSGPNSVYRCEFLRGLVWDLSHPSCWFALQLHILVRAIIVLAVGYRKQDSKSPEICRQPRLCPCLELLWFCYIVVILLTQQTVWVFGHVVAVNHLRGLVRWESVWSVSMQVMGSPSS